MFVHTFPLYHFFARLVVFSHIHTSHTLKKLKTHETKTVKKSSPLKSKLNYTFNPRNPDKKSLCLIDTLVRFEKNNTFKSSKNPKNCSKSKIND